MSGRIEIYNDRREHTSKWSRNERFSLKESGVDIGKNSQGGGTSDYNALENKPRINGNQLIGDKDSEVDLGIPEAEPLTNNQFNSLLAILN